MTMYTLGWATQQRYGDPLRRAVMLALAMSSGMQRDVSFKLFDLAHETEIQEADVVAALSGLADDCFLIACDIDEEGRGSALFPHDAFEAEPIPGPRPPFCSTDLRRRTIKTFDHICTYCRKPGDKRLGPDGSPWHIDRIVAGGQYRPDNVTLSCRPCNSRKRQRPAPRGTLSLAELEPFTVA